MTRVYSTQIFQKTQKSTQTRISTTWHPKRLTRSSLTTDQPCTRVVNISKHSSALKKCHQDKSHKTRSSGIICRCAHCILISLYMFRMRKLRTEVRYTTRSLASRFQLMLIAATIRSIRDLFWHLREIQFRKWSKLQEILNLDKLRSKRNLTQRLKSELTLTSFKKCQRPSKRKMRKTYFSLGL